jgi:hypothetical protein
MSSEPYTNQELTNGQKNYRRANIEVNLTHWLCVLKYQTDKDCLCLALIQNHL